MNRHVNGKPCWWCGKPMFKDADKQKNWDGLALHADHSKSRATYGIGRTHADRLLHDTCNKQRGKGDHDDQRPALLAITTNQPTNPDDLGPLVMGWPWTEHPLPTPTPPTAPIHEGQMT